MADQIRNLFTPDNPTDQKDYAIAFVAPQVLGVVDRNRWNPEQLAAWRRAVSIGERDLI